MPAVMAKWLLVSSGVVSRADGNLNWTVRHQLTTSPKQKGLALHLMVGGGELKLNQKSYYFFSRSSLFWILNGYKKNVVKKTPNFSSKS
jgi:hypothetical protein